MNAEIDSIEKLLFSQYKAYFVPILLLVGSFLIIIFAIVPQIQNYFSEKDEIAVLRRKISILKQNYETLSRVNDADQDVNLQLALSALPTNKDFIGVLNAVTLASSHANVTIGDYAFQVGDLSGKSDVKGGLPINLAINVNGGLSETKRFVDELLKTLPLSGVNNIQIQNTTTTVLIAFYYRPLPPQKFSVETPLPILSPEKKSVLDKLATFQSQPNQSPTFSLPSFQ